MVNWHDPALLLKSYIAFTKLTHAIAGIYIWEIVITSDFELEVLRGKRPYRWTIWLYLGTRYTGLLSFIFMTSIDSDVRRIICHPITIANFALGYASWAFASLIMLLRVIAMWNRNVTVSLIAVVAWSAALALSIRDLTMLSTTYSPIVKACIILHTDRALPNALGILVVDIVLLSAMLIGLLRYPQRGSSGMWKFLYQQVALCVIWIALAMISEIPPVVFLILNLDDGWNNMVIPPAAAILTIGATRMYRSLFDRGSITEYGSSDLPQFPLGNSTPAVPRSGDTIRFASVTRSDGTQTAGDVSVFLPGDQIHVGFVQDRSTPSLGDESTKERAAPNKYEGV